MEGYKCFPSFSLVHFPLGYSVGNAGFLFVCFVLVSSFVFKLRLKHKLLRSSEIGSIFDCKDQEKGNR